MACPEKWQFANYFGIRRKSIVVSHIDVRKTEFASPNACEGKTAHLRICENVNKNCQRGVTMTLIDVETNTEFVVPAGSIINQFIAVDKTCGNLDCNLSFMAGFLSDCIQDEGRLALLAQRIADQNHQITGTLLATFGSISVDLNLTSDALAAQLAIYNAEDSANGEEITNLDLGIVNGNNYVGEQKALMPAITVTSGNLGACDVDFFLCYVSACQTGVNDNCDVEDECAIDGETSHNAGNSNFGAFPGFGRRFGRIRGGPNSGCCGNSPGRFDCGKSSGSCSTRGQRNCAH